MADTYALHGLFRDIVWNIAILIELTSGGFGAVADAIGEHGGIKEALRSDNVANTLKELLRSLRLAQMAVPCPDGYRINMRHQMRSLQLWCGFPIVFFTFNPAAVARCLSVGFVAVCVPSACICDMKISCKTIEIDPL